MRPACCSGARRVRGRRICCSRRSHRRSSRASPRVGSPIRASLPRRPTSAVALVVIDRVDTADADAAAAIFTLYNAQKQRGGRLIAASRTPLAALPLREDLRTRLGWGLV